MKIDTDKRNFIEEENQNALKIEELEAENKEVLEISMKLLAQNREAYEVLAK